MKRDNGMKGQGDRSRGIEILMSDTFVKIKPTDPLKLVSHQTDDLKCPLLTAEILLGLVDSNKCFGSDEF
jgi:hypothetical protein